MEGVAPRRKRQIRSLLQGVDGGAQLVQVNRLDHGHARDRRGIRVRGRSATGCLVRLVQGCPKLREVDQSNPCVLPGGSVGSVQADGANPRDARLLFMAPRSSAK